MEIRVHEHLILVHVLSHQLLLGTHANARDAEDGLLRTRQKHNTMRRGQKDSLFYSADGHCSKILDRDKAKVHSKAWQLVRRGSRGAHMPLLLTTNTDLDGLNCLLV